MCVEIWSEVLKSLIFQGYDNGAWQGLDMVTPHGAPQGRYIVYYTSVFQKVFSKEFSKVFCIG